MAGKIQDFPKGLGAQNQALISMGAGSVYKRHIGDQDYILSYGKDGLHVQFQRNGQMVEVVIPEKDMMKELALVASEDSKNWQKFADDVNKAEERGWKVGPATSPPSAAASDPPPGTTAAPPPAATTAPPASGETVDGAPPTAPPVAGATDPAGPTAPPGGEAPPQTPAAPATPPKTSGFGSFMRGLADTVTLGHGPQVTAWVETRFNGKSYEENLTHEREMNAASRKEHPGWAVAGQGVGVAVDVVAGIVAWPWMAAYVIGVGAMDWQVNGQPGGFLGLAGKVWNGAWGTLSGTWTDIGNAINGTPLGPTLGSSAPTTSSGTSTTTPGTAVTPGTPGAAPGAPGTPAADPNSFTLPANATGEQIASMTERIKGRLVDPSRSMETPVTLKIGDRTFIFTTAGQPGDPDRARDAYNVTCYDKNGREVPGTTKGFVVGGVEGNYSTLNDYIKDALKRPGAVAAAPDGTTPVTLASATSTSGTRATPEQVGKIEGFATGSSTLTDAQRTQIAQWAETLKAKLGANPNLQVVVTGGHDSQEYTNANGDLTNKGLAASRAEAVRQELIKNGVPEGNLLPPSETETRAAPDAPPDSGGEAGNRMATVSVVDPTPPALTATAAIGVAAATSTPGSAAPQIMDPAVFDERPPMRADTRADRIIILDCGYSGGYWRGPIGLYDGGFPGGRRRYNRIEFGTRQTTYDNESYKSTGKITGVSVPGA